MAGVGVFGTTLAANITLGTDNEFQFGQGVVQTTRCDDAITVVPTSAFTNVAYNDDAEDRGGGSFKFGGINLTNIDAACNGKTFTLKAYGDAGGDPLDVISGVDTITFIWHDPSFGPDPADMDMDDTGTDDALVTFDTPFLPATDVFKVTLETS